MTKFRQCVRKLRKEGKLEDFAKAAGTTKKYIIKHLFAPNRVPRPALWVDLVAASNGELDDESMTEHFIKREKKRA